MCRPQATPTGRTPDQCRKTPRQLAQTYNKLGEYDAAVAQARPPHRRCRIACAQPACAPLAATASIIVHSRGTACRGRVLRRTPMLPRHDLRVDSLRAICRCHRTAAGLGTHGRVARDALRVWLRVRSVVSREWCCRPNHSFRRRPRCVRSVRPLAPVLESTTRALRPKDSSHARVHSAHSAPIRL